MNIHLDSQVASELAVAGLAGLAVGIEREWSGHAAGPAARFAGARTMLLLGLLGGVAGWLIGGGLLVAGALLLAAGSALTVAAYVMAARAGGESIEGTTEVAALLVLALGAVSGLGFPLLTSAVASVMVLALVEKTRIHGAVKQLGERELAAALQFAVLALVILPLLPEGPYGPFDSIRPRALWAVVLLFSGLNFAGYLARRAVGTTRGYGLTGLIGGLVSSTLVTLQFARRSREEPAAGLALGLGVVGACTVLVVRVGLVGTALNPRDRCRARALSPPGSRAGCRGSRDRIPAITPGRAARNSPNTSTARGPLVGYKDDSPVQLVLIAVPFALAGVGLIRVRVSRVALGLTDMDALTYAMAKLGTSPDAVALGADGIAIGIVRTRRSNSGWPRVVGIGPRRVAATGLLALGSGQRPGPVESPAMPYRSAFSGTFTLPSAQSHAKVQIERDRLGVRAVERRRTGAAVINSSGFAVRGASVTRRLLLVSVIAVFAPSNRLVSTVRPARHKYQRWRRRGSGLPHASRDHLAAGANRRVRGEASETFPPRGDQPPR